MGNHLRGGMRELRQELGREMGRESVSTGAGLKYLYLRSNTSSEVLLAKVKGHQQSQFLGQCLERQIRITPQC